MGTSDVDAERLGWLGMHNGESIWLKLTPPEKPQEAIDGTVGHPALDGDGQSELLDPESAEGVFAGVGS